ncbi:unnamed protein product [Parascedosporium putredinis]|uniref:C2H2-type domain-containing protein n=1 Tax=Parascedosporium putredinis TaxID=1442378 RepID=A0A9P1MCH6_9PEZI|nr:unnamed protein product [Parascedosporium putredinis]CAI7998434.1 unnamed protein product [Parascedosporium putredinis]
MSSASFYDGHTAAAAGALPPQPGAHHRSFSGAEALDSGHLSPHYRSRSNSVLSNHQADTHTPADSLSTMDHYQSSDFGGDEDPFFGVDFSREGGGTPTFLEDSFVAISRSNIRSEAHFHLPANISAQLKRFQMTPTVSDHSSDDEQQPTAVNAPTLLQSPLVTISDWGKGPTPLSHAVERSFELDTPARPPSSHSTPGDLLSGPPPPIPGPFRNNSGTWLRESMAGPGGLGPENRPRTATESVNSIVSKREIEERKKVVASWLDQSTEQSHIPTNDPRTSLDGIVRMGENEDDGIPLGDKTENRFLPDQTYFLGGAGAMTAEDLEIIYSGRNWADAPQIHPIRRGEGSGGFQPESSRDAMMRYERMCRDNDSIISDTATWGTRPQSVVAVTDRDIEGLSGNLLKKLTISRGDPRRTSGGLLSGIRTLVKKPSATLKRSLSGHDEASFTNSSGEKADSTARLAPPTRTSSWGKKQTPSINTALVSMGQSVAAVGAGQASQAHGRSGSISATSVTSPKSPFGGLVAKTTTTIRPRSKSDLPRASTRLHPGGPSTLAGLWRKNGGPPVGTIATSTITVAHDAEEEDDDDYDLDDHDMRMEPSDSMESIVPTYEGFKAHILRLNPGLSPDHYLVERIAMQQVTRYKHLLSAKVKHLQQGRGLPAMMECQLCFQAKKFQKPSDWTKHVHEDVQPFTCTWEGCKEPKIFKRKADWVRHENEGHRHLDCWDCDVDDCAHKCYRRDNFLQHLVREHKFVEPIHKTKGALKKFGGNDPTWKKVEQCHVLSAKKAEEEPCKFCNRKLPSFKKLTVHLAKHMEQISLPILRLVAAAEVTADTVVSPVQGPPRPGFGFHSPGAGTPMPLSGYMVSGSSANDGPGHHSTMATTTVPIPYQIRTDAAFEYDMNSGLSTGSFQDSLYLGGQFGGNAMESGMATGGRQHNMANYSGNHGALYGQTSPGTRPFTQRHRSSEFKVFRSILPRISTAPPAVARTSRCPRQEISLAPARQG